MVAVVAESYYPARDMKKLKAPPTSSRLSTRAKSASKNKSKVAGANKTALQGTVAKGKPREGEVRHVPWSSIAVESLNPLLALQFVVGQNIMLARVLLKKGCIVPEHSHPNEQITFILEGALKFWIDGREIVVRSGEVLTIPPNMPHKAEALEDTVDIDVFDPPRADWMNKTNSYLR
jgi:quercetin dioxygenase-like cupin family protein